jgi:hypothetical protein
MKYIVVFLIVLALMGTPVFLFSDAVLPQLFSLQQVYSQADANSQLLVSTR